jgi:hypothetical protein
MKKVVKIFAVIVLLGIILTSTASATFHGTADIKGHNNSLSDRGQLWGGGLTGGTYYTGVYSWTNAGGTGWGTLVPNWGFCIELTQVANNGLVDVIDLNEAPLPVAPLYGTPMGDTKANYIRELWNSHFDPDWTTGPTDKNERELAEAFGAAVWEIIYEALPASPLSWDVNTGTGFHATGIEKAAIANDWLHNLTGTSDPAYLAENLFAISPTNAQPGQDYLVQLTSTPAPEPATMALLGLGALSLIRRKRNVWFVPMVRRKRTKLKRN